MANDMTNELSNRDYLILRAYQAGIHEPQELAAFMGQMEVESGRFASMHENLNYSGRRLLQVFPGRNGVDTLTEAEAIASGGPEIVANAIYGGEWGRENLGNTELGDGWRFHGRGYVQLTGRDNYSRDGRETGLDLVGSPDLAADRANAATIAVHYWRSRVVQREHQHDVREATHDINGGYSHLPERRAAIRRWETMLTPYVMDRLSKGEVALPSSGERNSHRELTRTLQENLNLLGVKDDENKPLLVDGDLGKRTTQAIANFQRQHGLSITGTADALTLSAIESGVRAIKSFKAIENFGDEFLPSGYRTDWLERDTQGLPNYLHASRPSRPGDLESPAHRTSIAPASPSLRSGSSPAPEHIRTTLRHDELTVLPPLPTTQTLEPGDRSAAVQALQQHLQLLGATDRYGHKIQTDRDYGDRTREAVEQFQLWTGRESTGIADSGTLQALQMQAQFALRQRAQGIAITPDAHLTERLRPAMPDLADAADERPVLGRSPLTHANNPSSSQHSKRAEQEPEVVPDRPHFSTQTFPNHHRDNALFEAIRRQLPPGTSDEMAAHVMLQAKFGGVGHVGKLDEVIVQDGRAYVAGKTPGDMAAVDLSAPVPALQETLRQSATFDTQQAVQLAQFREQQRAIDMPGGGLTMG